VLIPTPQRILVATRPVDFRKSIDGLAAVTELVLGERALSGALFVFVNRRRSAVKMLVWDRGGFVLVYKKLERGRFRLPDSDEDRVVLTPAELAAVLEGIDLSRARRLARWNPQTSVADTAALR
jgi:transposase